MTERDFHVPQSEAGVETRVTARTTVHRDLPARYANREAVPCVRGIFMSASSARLPTPEGPGSVSGAPNLPAGLTCEGEKIRAGNDAL